MKPSTSKVLNSTNGNLINKTSFNYDLIEFVRLNPVLYDFKHENYTSVPVKNAIWAKFSEKHGMEITDVKARWNILRTGFTTAKRRYEGGLIKGKKWEYLDKMMFLSDFLKPSDTLVFTPKRLKASNGDQLLDSINDEEEDMMPEVEQELYEESTSNQSILSSDLNQVQNSTNKTNEIVYDQLNQLVNHLNDDFYGELLKTYLDEQKNPTLMFLKSLLPSLNKYNDEQLNIIKHRFMGVIIEADEEFKKSL